MAEKAEKRESTGVRAPHNTGAGSSRSVDGSEGDTGAAIRDQIRDRGARTARLAYTDPLGQAGFVLLPAADLKRALAGRIVVQDFDQSRGGVVLSPDPRTLKFLQVDGATALTAQLTCDIRLPDGAAAPGCARQSLKRAIELLRRVGLTVRVSVDCLQPLAATQSVDVALISLVSESVVAALADCPVPGLTLRCADPARSVAIGFGPMPPIEAADALPLVHRLIVRAMQQHGIPSLAAPQILSRLGLSMHRGKRSLFSGQSPPHDAGAAFLAGTRIHAPGLTALLRPSLAGVTWDVRAAPAATDSDGTPGWTWGSGWAGPLSISYARDSGSMTAAGLDGTGNPYLMLAGLICSGLDGLRRGTGANETVCEADAAPPCPPDPALALAGLVIDECLRDGLGGATVDAYAEAVRIRWEHVRSGDHR